MNLLCRVYLKAAITAMAFIFCAHALNAGGEVITFKSQPAQSALRGQVYEYDILAVSSLGNPVYYSLRYGPEGAKVDKTTGKLTWTPTDMGVYEFRVVASSNPNQYGAPQTWQVTVPKCEELSTISGAVTDSADNPIENSGVAILTRVLDDQNVIKCNILNGSYRFINLDAGEYFLDFALESSEPDKKLRAKTININCGENVTFNFKNYSPNPNNALHFVTQPPLTAVIGKEYKYKATAWAVNHDLKVRYRLSGNDYPYENVKGVSLDENTGELRWTPDSLGEYFFRIQASAEENVEVPYQNCTQEWTVRIIACDNPAKIKAKIVESGDVHIWSRNALLFNRAPDDPKFDQIKSLVCKTEIEEKNYGQEKNLEFDNVDKGTYYLYIEPIMFTTQDSDPREISGYWYESAFDGEKATPIEVACGETKDLTIRVFPQEPYFYKISGRVTYDDGSPVEKAHITLLRDDSYIGMPKRYWNGSAGAGETDAEGYYEIYAPSNYEFLAEASNPLAEDSLHAGFHRTLYYDQTGDRYLAKEFSVDTNYENINFVFPKYKPFANSISGKITLEGGLPDPLGTYVELTPVKVKEEYKYWQYRSFTAKVNEDGTYTAENLLPGEYIVFAAETPVDRNFGVYYKEGSNGTREWGDATIIIVGESSKIENINLILPKIKGIINSGGKIKGKVFGQEKKQIVKGEGDAPEAKPILRANVYAVNSAGEVTGLDRTDSDGSFSINGLNSGEYTLQIDKPGYDLYSTKVQLQGTEAETEIELPLKGLYEKPSVSSLIVSPNPVSDVMRIDFQAAGTSRISLVNSIGEKVFSADLGRLEGAASYEIKTGSYPQGAYYLILESGARASALPVAIVK